MAYRGLQDNSLVKARRQRLLSKREREEVLAGARELLWRESRILLALVFGSFTRGGLVRDLDIAVYLSEPKGILEDYEYCETLASKLSANLGIPVDIVALNYAGDHVFNDALTTGTPLVIREPWLYEALRLLAVEQINLFHHKSPR